MPASGRGVLDGFLDRWEVARELRVGVRTLDRWRGEGLGPPFIRLGRRIYYSVDQLRRWLAELQQRPASNQGPDRG